MKTLVALIGFSAVFHTATACITAHAYLQSCLIGGDAVSAQVYDDGVEVCSGGKTTNGASDDTVFCTPCNDGYSFCVSDKARKAVVTSPNGYSASMTTTDTHDMGYTCGNVGDAAKIKGLEVESCFRDEFGNCDAQPSCQLCDYRSDCKTTGG